MVDDLVMPAVGFLLGDVDFGDLFLVLDPGAGPGGYATLQQAQAAGAVTVNYGRFLNSAIALLLVAVVMFVIIRAINLGAGRAGAPGSGMARDRRADASEPTRVFQVGSARPRAVLSARVP